MINVLSGALAPESLKAIISAGASGIDLTTVTGVTLSIKDPAGNVTTWAAVIVSATITSLTISHAFQAGDTDAIGRYGVVANLTVPGGTVRAKCPCFDVVDQFS